LNYNFLSGFQQFSFSEYYRELPTEWAEYGNFTTGRTNEMIRGVKCVREQQFPCVHASKQNSCCMRVRKLRIAYACA